MKLRALNLWDLWRSILRGSGGIIWFNWKNIILNGTKISKPPPYKKFKELQLLFPMKHIGNMIQLNQPITFFGSKLAGSVEGCTIKLLMCFLYELSFENKSWLLFLVWYEMENNEIGIKGCLCYTIIRKLCARYHYHHPSQNIYFLESKLNPFWLD